MGLACATLLTFVALMFLAWRYDVLYRERDELNKRLSWKSEMLEIWEKKYSASAFKHCERLNEIAELKKLRERDAVTLGLAVTDKEFYRDSSLAILAALRQKEAELAAVKAKRSHKKQGG